MALPFLDRNPSSHPKDRKLAIVLFSIMIFYWATLVIIGSFFRGPGFLFVFPWSEGLFFEF
jgi:quinol-cytochrome oxidoreductase complex cytochrome b subunit